MTAQIFYKYRHKNINVSNLDYIMEKESRIPINTNLNEDNLLFDNINEKINFIKFIWINKNIGIILFYYQ